MNKKKSKKAEAAAIEKAAKVAAKAEAAAKEKAKAAAKAADKEKERVTEIKKNRGAQLNNTNACKNKNIDSRDSGASKLIPLRHY